MLYLLVDIKWDNFRTQIGGEKLSHILWSLGIIIGTMLLKKPLANLLARLSCTIANRFGDKKHGYLFKNLVRRPVELLLQTLLFYIAVSQLSVFLDLVLLHRADGTKAVLDIRLGDVVDHMFLFLLVLYTTWFLSRVLDFIFHVLIDNAKQEKDNEKQQLFPLIKEMAKLLLWAIGIFWVMGTVFHVNVPALITGLGIGGVAIALAAKESVENFFAAFTILADKPFQAGDVLKLDNMEGSVERIGFRSTSLRNSDGSVFIVPNKKLVNEHLENLTRRENRRVRLPVNIKYGMPAGALEKAMSEIKTLLEKTVPVQKPVDLFIEAFGEETFQMIVQYHLPEPLPEGTKLVAVKQAVNMAVFDILNKNEGFNKADANNYSSNIVSP